MTEKPWHQSGTLQSTFLWLGRIQITHLKAEPLLPFGNAWREPWSYLRSGLPQASALKTSPARFAVGINKDLLATHIAGCPTRTKLGKASSRKHSASPPGLLHLLSWEWAKGEKQDHSYSCCSWQAHCCLSCRQKEDKSNLILLQWDFLCYYQEVLLYWHLRPLKLPLWKSPSSGSASG